MCENVEFAGVNSRIGRCWLVGSAWLANEPLSVFSRIYWFHFEMSDLTSEIEFLRKEIQEKQLRLQILKIQAVSTTVGKSSSTSPSSTQDERPQTRSHQKPKKTIRQTLESMLLDTKDDTGSLPEDMSAWYQLFVNQYNS